MHCFFIHERKKYSLITVHQLVELFYKRLRESAAIANVTTAGNTIRRTCLPIGSYSHLSGSAPFIHLPGHFNLIPQIPDINFVDPLLRNFGIQVGIFVHQRFDKVDLTAGTLLVPEAEKS